MTLTGLVQNSTPWLAWCGLGLTGLTILSFLINWNAKFRLIGASVFTLLLAGSSWAFTASYTPPLAIEGAKYAPVVYDNGSDLVVAQASKDFPEEAIQPTLEQIAGNLKGRGVNGAMVHIRLRKLVNSNNGITTPIVIGEIIRDIPQGISIKLPIEKDNE